MVYILSFDLSPVYETVTEGDKANRSGLQRKPANLEKFVKLGFSYDVYVPHTKYSIYINVKDPRSKVGGTFQRHFYNVQHLSKIALHNRYTS